jgi:hypothetical protein
MGQEGESNTIEFYLNISNYGDTLHVCSDA